MASWYDEYVPLIVTKCCRVLLVKSFTINIHCLIYIRKGKLKLQTILLLVLLDSVVALVDYDSQIQPIFDDRCITCHGNAAGLNLASYNNVMDGGNSGDVVVPGDHSSSALFIRITLPSSSDEDMPPQGSLSQFEIDLIAQWIDEGALPNVPDCDPTLGCGQAETCCNGFLYPTTCCETNCDEPIGECGDDALAGDLNDDGILNILDVVLMVNMALDGGYEDAADMNGDGVINILDIVTLINTILN